MLRRGWRVRRVGVLWWREAVRTGFGETWSGQTTTSERFLETRTWSYFSGYPTSSSKAQSIRSLSGITTIRAQWNTRAWRFRIILQGPTSFLQYGESLCLQQIVDSCWLSFRDLRPCVAASAPIAGESVPEEMNSEGRVARRGDQEGAGSSFSASQAIRVRFPPATQHRP